MQEVMESQPDQTSSDENDEFEISPSEMVEVRIPMEEMEAEDATAQTKRPRRRRRRRRRKRPKPPLNTEDADSYYVLPEEEVKRKPLKYRPENVDEQVPESSNEPPPPPRRRNVKRRRRPIKRPPMEEYQSIGDANMDTTNITDKSIPKHPNDDQGTESKTENDGHEEDAADLAKSQTKDEAQHQKTLMDMVPPPFLVRSVPKVNDVGHGPIRKESFESPRKETFESTASKGGDPSKSLMGHKDAELPKVPPKNLIGPKDAEPTKSHISLDGGNAENEQKVPEEHTTSVRSRKRPPSKNETKFESQSEAAASDLKNIRKNDENANKIVNKSKNDDRLKYNETKKEVFKLRRLPPISAILRQAKMRPKNESFLRPPFKHETSKIKENVGNEILTHVAVNEAHGLIQNETNKDELGGSSTPGHEEDAEINHNDGFEFPIITYTEQRHKQTSVSVTTTDQKSTTPTSGSGSEQKSSDLSSSSHAKPKPTTTSTASSASSTTENTAFIYIPCNQTVSDLRKGASNVTVENATRNAIGERTVPDGSKIGHSNDSIMRHNETTNIIDVAALNELEKLLQSEMENAEPTEIVIANYSSASAKLVTTLGPYMDHRPPDLEFDYPFQNKATGGSKFTKDSQDAKFWPDYNPRQPKRLHQESSKYKPETKEEGIPMPKSNLGYGKDIILSYTSTGTSVLFNEIDPQELLRENEWSAHLRHNSSHRRPTPDGLMHKNKNNNERKKLPLAVKSAIIISGAILALAVLGFFALLLSCKIRHAKSRMKCHRELYREQFQNSEFRQSSRSTSPVVSKLNYNGRSFTNNIQSNVASNRNYYLWQTLRKTFQYD